MASIFVVDDEKDIRDLLKYNLEKEGHKVITLENGVQCLEAIKHNKPDLILLDVMMPGMDGIEICERIKQLPANKDILICFLTARNEDYSQIAGLEAGGDDYISKPIKPKLLMTKVSAFLRRKETINLFENSQPKGLFINREKYLIEKEGMEIHLPRKEFELLALLASRPNIVLNRQVILEKVWGADIIVGDRTIDVHIRNLRKKIGNQYIATVKGIGYKFNE